MKYSDCRQKSRKKTLKKEMSKIEEAAEKKAKQAGEKLIEEEYSELGGVGAVQNMNVSVLLFRNAGKCLRCDQHHCFEPHHMLTGEDVGVRGLLQSPGPVIQCPFIVLFFLIYQVASLCSNIWLSNWTEDPLLKKDSLSNTSKYTDRRDVYLGIYGSLGLLQGGN